jgi:hypothetical protein
MKFVLFIGFERTTDLKNIKISICIINDKKEFILRRDWGRNLI